MGEAAHEVMDLAVGNSRGDHDSSRLLSLALARLLEVLGEAATRDSIEFRQLAPAIPRAEVIGMRNRLIRGCAQVDHDIVWAAGTADLPSLSPAPGASAKEPPQEEP